MYNYLESMKDDVMAYIEENVNYSDYETIEELQEKLHDDLWVDDSVTGNASGSYTFNNYKAKEYVEDNMDLLREACREFGVESSEIGEKFLDEEYEWMDVTIRCYLLDNAISDVMEEIEDDFEDAHEEYEEDEEE